MRITSVVSLLNLLSLLVGCATGEKVRAELRPRLTRAQVVSSTGNPDAVRSAGDSELLQYTNRLISGWSLDGGIVRTTTAC